MKPRKENWTVHFRKVFFTKRYIRAFVGALSLLATVCLFRLWNFDLALDTPEIEAPALEPIPERLPPTYNKYHERERNFPQHSLDLPPPNGKHAKYLWFSNHAHGSGWGNIMQEIITNANLAWETDRAFVFHNYTWKRDGPFYSTFNNKTIPSRIPLSALISGPIIGGPFDAAHSHIPLSVSREYFNKVCPKPVMLHYVDVPESYDGKLEGSEVLRLWAKKIKSIDDPCVMINPESPSVFDVWFFGDPRSRSLFPSLKASPALTQFGWSELVLSAFETNRHLFFPPSSRIFPAFFGGSSKNAVAPPNDDKYALIPHLLALHIRRGDFKDHCIMLANWSANWNGFNRFPTLPDQFNRPLDGGAGYTTPENMDMYLRKCFPSIEQIVERVREIRSTPAGASLSDIYIMSNAPRDWTNQLSTALKKADPGVWRSIASGRDLKLDWEQKFVAQAVDMYAGQRAGVFIGNGFSSLTSNVVLIRMQRDVPPEQTRFW